MKISIRCGWILDLMSVEFKQIKAQMTVRRAEVEISIRCGWSLNLM